MQNKVKNGEFDELIKAMNEASEDLSKSLDKDCFAKMAVRYKCYNPHKLITTVIIHLPKGIKQDEDTYYTHCFHTLTLMLGEEPKWIRLLGFVEITPL